MDTANDIARCKRDLWTIGLVIVVPLLAWFTFMAWLLVTALACGGIPCTARDEAEIAVVVTCGVFIAPLAFLYFAVHYPRPIAIACVLAACFMSRY